LLLYYVATAASSCCIFAVRKISVSQRLCIVVQGLSVGWVRYTDTRCSFSPYPLTSNLSCN